METYGYISAVSVVFYCFMLLTFLAAKKNKIVNSFLILLVAMIAWTGGSYLMRAQFWPSYTFWFQVSLAGILLLPYAYSSFIYALAGVRKGIVDHACSLLMLIAFLVNIPEGILLHYPEIFIKDGRAGFIYSVGAGMLVYAAIAVVILFRLLRVIWMTCRKNRNMRRQFEPMVWGMVLLLLGNMAIGLPFFEGFPIDILSGLLNALCLFFVLIKRRLFRLQMLASEGVCYGVGLMISAALLLNVSPVLEADIKNKVPVLAEYYPMIFSLCFLAAYWCLSYIWKALVGNVFIKEEMQQAEKLKNFNATVSKSLRLGDTMQATIEVIKDIVHADSVYICMQGMHDTAYKAMYSDKPLNELGFTLEPDNPIVVWLQNHEEPLFMKGFRYTVEYKSMWENEKFQMEKKNVECCVGLKDGDQLIGIILLACSRNKGHLSGCQEEHILSSVSSVASIAVKNARLYEHAYLEARTDELTGLLNRKCFYEVMEEEYEKNKDGSLALAILNVDDFKLYNQLYGVTEGDLCLKRIADIIKSSVGDNGFASRFNGKVFSILLPKYDVFSTRNLVESICTQISQMNRQGKEYKLKSITVSAGISAAPYAAKSVKELVDNADMAVYHVKENGKNGIKVFDTMIRNKNGGMNSDGTEHAHIYRAYEPTIYALTAAIDAKDHYTFGHSNNVAYYATELAQYMGLNEDVVEIIRQSALLHDVGKIGIPEGILNKPGKLTEEEYEIIKGHVEASIEIIRHLPSLDYVIPAVIGHHERFDGGGYPRRIAGEDIPATARILCVADSFDAMTSRRCYRDSFSLEKAKRILLEEAGRQFDPEIARMFVRCLEEGKIRVVDAEYSRKKMLGVL